MPHLMPMVVMKLFMITAALQQHPNENIDFNFRKSLKSALPIQTKIAGLFMIMGVVSFFLILMMTVM